MKFNNPEKKLHNPFGPPSQISEEIALSIEERHSPLVVKAIYNLALAAGISQEGNGAGDENGGPNSFDASFGVDGCAVLLSNALGVLVDGSTESRLELVGDLIGRSNLTRPQGERVSIDAQVAELELILRSQLLRAMFFKLPIELEKVWIDEAKDFVNFSKSPWRDRDYFYFLDVDFYTGMLDQEIAYARKLAKGLDKSLVLYSESIGDESFSCGAEIDRLRYGLDAVISMPEDSGRGVVADVNKAKQDARLYRIFGFLGKALNYSPTKK